MSDVNFRYWLALLVRWSFRKITSIISPFFSYLFLKQSVRYHAAMFVIIETTHFHVHTLHLQRRYFCNEWPSPAILRLADSVLFVITQHVKNGYLQAVHPASHCQRINKADNSTTMSWMHTSLYTLTLQSSYLQICHHLYNIPVVKIDCSKRLAFLLHDFKLISNQQQLISKTDTDAKSI